MSGTPPSGPARGALRLLADPMLGGFIAARMMTTTGVWIFNIVAVILTFEVSGSALMVGMVSVAQFGPQLVLTPLSGALADRGDRRSQLIAGRLVVAVGSASLAIWVGLEDVGSSMGVWPIIVAAFVVGLGFVLTVPAQESLFPSMVQRNELAAAIALNAVPPTFARAVGPALGAAIAASVGPATAFAISAVGDLFFALVVWLINVPSRASSGGGGDARVRAGIRYVSGDTGLFFLLCGIVAVGVGADPAITLSPPLAGSFGRGVAHVGLFASAFGIGSLSVFPILGRLRRQVGLPRLASTGLVMLAGGLLGAGNLPTVALATVSFVISGAGMTMGFTSLNTQIQERLPEDLRGRIMALWAVAFLGSRPVAAGLNGALADRFGLSTAFTVVACLVALLAWTSRPGAVAKARPHLDKAIGD